MLPSLNTALTGARRKCDEVIQSITVHIFSLGRGAETVSMWRHADWSHIGI
jgi:hypothetical protein